MNAGVQAIKEDFILYAFVCHNIVDSGHYFGRNQDELVKRFGYDASNDEFSRIEGRLRLPADILR
jgi:ubiquitin C-terminal hydrolase